MTGLAAIIFAIVDHPHKPLLSPDTTEGGKVELNDDDDDSSHSDSVVYIFRQVEY